MIKRSNFDSGFVAVVRQDGGSSRVQLLLPDDYPEFAVVKDHDTTAILRDYTSFLRAENGSKLTVFRIFPVKNDLKSNAFVRSDRGRTRPAPPEIW